MDSYSYDNIPVYSSNSYNTNGFDLSVPDGTHQYGQIAFDDSSYYNDINSLMYKQQNHPNTCTGMPRHHSIPASCVKTENPVSGVPYNPGVITPIGHQFHVGDTTFFGGHGPYAMSSPGAPPVSPYGNRSVSEGTVSSTVSSPRSPPGHFLREDEEYSRVSDDQLTQMSARDLNKHFKEFTPVMITQLKKKRRTLKNRGYALNSRMKRVQQKADLEIERDSLREQLRERDSEVSHLKKQLDAYKRKVSTLEDLLSDSGNSR
jgi:hypothetical protein